MGYIGLPTAIIAAEKGFEVVGFDIDEQRVARINSFDPVIEEPEIVGRLDFVLKNKSFRATSEIESADYYIIAVPTPLTSEHGVDLSFVWSALDFIMLVMQSGNSIILESTVPVGTTEKIVQRVKKHNPAWEVGKDFFAAHCPERVLPGNIFYELEHNDRIIGGYDEESSAQVTQFYRTFVKGNIYFKTSRLAEMVKLIENSSRDVQIAFAHQVAAMAEAAKLNPYEVIHMANKHPRVNVLNPTCGVGGHCIAIDPYFLIESFPQQTQLIAQARQVNNMRTQQVISQICRALQDFDGKPTVLLAGLTYKANVDDLRESPALKIAAQLAQLDTIDLLVAEPNVAPIQLHEYVAPSQIVNFNIGIEKADVVVLLVAHTSFNLQNHMVLLQTKLVLDFCGSWFKVTQDSSNFLSNVHGSVEKEL